jgi:hypothetical protein
MVCHGFSSRFSDPEIKRSFQHLGPSCMNSYRWGKGKNEAREQAEQ